MPRALASVRRDLWCIVLAAGGSSRLGHPKQLLRYRGRPLLLHAIEAASGVDRERVVVVLGAGAPRMRSMLRRRGIRTHVVQNGQWRDGLASSLRAGLARLPPRARAALILLSDQPMIDSASVDRLVAAWARRPGAPAAADYAGRTGVPAILPRSHFAAANRLCGDVGARALLRGPAAVTRVPMPEAELDVDTPSDAERLCRI